MDREMAAFRYSLSEYEVSMRMEMAGSILRAVPASVTQSTKGIRISVSRMSGFCASSSVACLPSLATMSSSIPFSFQGNVAEIPLRV